MFRIKVNIVNKLYFYIVKKEKVMEKTKKVIIICVIIIILIISFILGLVIKSVTKKEDMPVLLSNNNTENEIMTEIINKYINYINNKELDALVKLYDIEELKHFYREYSINDIKAIFNNVFGENDDYKFEINAINKAETENDIKNAVGYDEKVAEKLAEYLGKYHIYFLDFNLKSNGQYISTNETEIIVINKEDSKYTLVYTGFLDTL